MAADQTRSSIAFFTTYRPLVSLDIFSVPIPTSDEDELHMTDGVSSNYNCNTIPPQALKSIIKRPKLASVANEADIDSGNLSGLIFVSERDGLETLYVALRFNKPKSFKVFSLFVDVYDMSDIGVRMEDSACFAGDYLVYVSTIKDPEERRQPWNVVYKTHLQTGHTHRLTPSWHADLSPAASPNGKMIAVASFQRRGGWHGEIEDLQTDIYVMNLEKPFNRRLLVKNGGWPTWGSDRFIFFHRMVVDEVDPDGKIKKKHWAVFRANTENKDDIILVTSGNIDAMTPAAISGTKVAVATIYMKSDSSERSRAEQYRHIEILDLNAPHEQPTKLTLITRPKADHYNPFVIDGGKRIGYHRCNADLVKMEDEMDEAPSPFQKLKCPISDVGLFRVSGVFPTFSRDGSKLAFVDNALRTVWLVERESDPRVIYQDEDDNVVFSPVWNQKEDTLYVCKGPSFSAQSPVQICAIFNASKVQTAITLTDGGFNDAFPSSNPRGDKLVFRSTRDGGNERHKNLYIMENARKGEFHGGKITRLTKGDWTDTHCQWSPREDWIVFSSTRDKPQSAPKSDNDLDPGYFAVFLVNVKDPKVVIRVMGSGYDLAGHVNHPFFSPDGKSIVVSADLAAVSADPISLPLFLHSVRPYGDIFTVDINLDDIKNNEDLKFKRITHSRYENATPAWILFSTDDPNETWHLPKEEPYTPSCPCADSHKAESWLMTGHLCIPKRCC